LETNYIKEYREAKDWSISELAKLSGVPRSTLGEIEIHKRNPKQEHLEQIAAALGITVEELYIKPKALD